MTEVPATGVPVAPLDRETYSPAQIAERWDCSVEVVRYLIHSGELDGFRAGRRLIRVRADKLAEYEISRGSARGVLGPRVPQEGTAVRAQQLRDLRSALRTAWRRREGRERERQT